MMLQGKAAIVTGGASGIGEAIVRELVQEGARVIVADFDEAGAHNLAEELGHAVARPFRVDVAEPERVRDMVAFAVESFGALHLAVNNAGISAPKTLLADIAIDDWHRIVNVDLNAVFYSMKYEIPAMIAAGGGAIVNMASILGAVGWEGAAAYVTSKHGVLGLTKTAALDYAAHGIRVNAVGPGFVATKIVESSLSQDEQGELADLHALKRIGQPHEIAGLTSFLLSEKASFLTGAYYPADGGFLAR